MFSSKTLESVNMGFSEQLVKFRKEKGLTQQGLADLVQMHITQIYRYETGSSQPTLDAIRKIAIALGVSADELIFDKHERDPDEELRMLFEAIKKFPPEAKKIVKEVLESLVIKNEAKRWT